MSQQPSGNDMSTQIAIDKSNQLRNFTKCMQVLVGICSGIVADNVISPSEMGFLRQWLSEHADLATAWPANVIARRIEEILADGIVTKDEHDNLLDTLKQLTGNFFEETGAAQQAGTTLPIDSVDEILLTGVSVCFTGEFIYGTRSACERAMIRIGAAVSQGVNKKLDYLVIGALASPDWANQTYGRKIEKAVAYRSSEGRPLIISEHQWTAALTSKNL